MQYTVVLGRQCVGVTRCYRHSNAHASSTWMSALSPSLGRASLFSPASLSEFPAPPSTVAKYSQYPESQVANSKKKRERQPSLVYLSVLCNLVTVASLVTLAIV